MEARARSGSTSSDSWSRPTRRTRRSPTTRASRSGSSCASWRRRAEPGLEVSRVEADRPGPSFTVDTLRELHDAFPGDELTFIVGGDQALGLPDWREPEAVLSLARVAVADRGEVTPRGRSLERCAGLDTSRLDFFAMPRLDISSTDLRARVAAGPADPPPRARRRRRPHRARIGLVRDDRTSPS